MSRNQHPTIALNPHPNGLYFASYPTRHIATTLQHIAAIRLLDDLFFLSALSTHTNLILDLHTKAVEIGKWGSTTWPEMRSDEVTIKLFNSDDPRLPFETPEDKLRGYLGTLLHEMIHAFFQLYSCGCSICKREAFERYGRSGHGWHWIDVAISLQWHCESEWVLGLCLDLQIAEGLVMEMREFGKGVEGIPHEEQLRKWEMPREFLERVVLETDNYRGKAPGSIRRGMWRVENDLYKLGGVLFGDLG
ncbi:hypothetical protein B0J14DRAFT_646963 [Halenospora varia]|nr:hypothetical protein B0J14DRAFT_646963 [Halenospora varia]